MEKNGERLTPVGIADSVSHRIWKTLRSPAKKRFRAFTLAEIIVVIAILSVLATIGFVSLSAYRSSATDAKGAANVRSVLTAISAESSISGRSPREFVKHDPEYAISWSSVVVFDGIPSILVPGPYWTPGTNYSAGNPDYAKLRLDPERFKVADTLPAGLFPIWPRTRADVSNPEYVLVGAADVNDMSWKKPRPQRFVQTAGILSTSVAFVVGDYPAWMEGSVGGLIRDPEDPSGTWALVDGAETGGPAPCESGEVSWYDVPALPSWSSTEVEKATDNGVLRTTATCSFSKISISWTNAVCDSWYVPDGTGSEPSCVADVCWSSVPANAASNATSQSVSGNWHRSATPWQCTFECSDGYSWDGSACRASCPTPLSAPHNGLTYAFSELVSIPNWQSATLTGTHVFGVAPENGELSASFWFACADGATTVTVAEWPAACQQNLTWNGSRTTPACSPDTRSTSCGWSVPTNATSSTPPTYVQMWDGLAAAWLPEKNWSVGAPVCGYSCNANYVPSGGSCVWAAQTASCTGLPSNAVWNTASSVTQTWDGSSWAPSTAGTYSAAASTTSCVFKCAANYTWNGVSCQADTKAFSCAAKPATGTDWNTVSSYVQTWNGSAWAPADSATAYDTAASAAACRYKCSSGYGWDSGTSTCKASVWGSCGTATAASYSYPTANWCAAGTKADADTSGTDGAFDWTCSGQFGGTAATCSSPKKLDGVCGSSDGDALASAPSANLCSVWTASAVTGTGPWSWTCAGVNSGNSASCSATKASYTVTWNGNSWTPSEASRVVTYNTAVWTLPTATRTGYSFNGWFTATSGGIQITSATAITAAVTYYAQWTQLTYAVSGSFWTNANGATVSVCWANVTADSAWAFSRTGIPYGTACNNVTATRTNYACSTTTNGPASLTANVTNVAGSCSANSQTYTCTAKPATGTDWNTVSSYLQTWNGSAWSPAGTTTAYNATASTTACRYKCSSGYGWDSGTSTCKASVNWACSTTAGACTAGTASWDNGATACWTTRTWSCTGQFGWTTASCSKANAACATGKWSVVGCIPSSSCSPVCTSYQVNGGSCNPVTQTSSCCAPETAYCGWPGSSFIYGCKAQ